MTDFNYGEWIVNEYQEMVRQHRDGLEVEKSREAAAHRLLDAVQNGDAPSPEATFDWAFNIASAALNVERKSRRNSLRKNLEYIVEAFTTPDNAIHVEPFLDQVFPLGSHDGRDKALRYWTAEDFTASSMERYRNAAAAAEAARQYEELAANVTEQMKRLHVGHLGDCFHTT